MFTIAGICIIPRKALMLISTFALPIIFYIAASIDSPVCNGATGVVQATSAEIASLLLLPCSLGRNGRSNFTEGHR